MGKLTEEQKLLECLFGHHDFFTEGCVRQCKRCRCVQVYSGDEWVTVKLEHAENFDLEAMTELQRLVDTMNPSRKIRHNNTNDQWSWKDACDYPGPKWEKGSWIK